MPKITREGWQALYNRGIVEEAEIKEYLSQDGIPEGAVGPVLEDLEKGRRRWEAEGATGDRPALGPTTWLPDQVWLLALGMVGPAEAGAQLAREEWSERDRALWLALGRQYTLELVEARRHERAR